MCLIRQKKKVEFLQELYKELILLGDFNFVETALDRSPIREDDYKIKEEFNEFKIKWKKSSHLSSKVQ